MNVSTEVSELNVPLPPLPPGFECFVWPKAKAKQINTHGSRRRAHHFFLPHQVFFFSKKNLKKNYKIIKKNKFKFYFFLFFYFWNIKNPV